MSEPQREQTLNEGVPTEQGYKSYEKATQKEIALGRKFGLCKNTKVS